MPIVKRLNEICVMLVDGHPTFRKGIDALIESEPGLRVIAEAGDCGKLLEIIIGIRHKFPNARVIVLTAFDMGRDIVHAIRSNAKSFLLKDTPEDQPDGIIRGVHASKDALPSKLTQRVAVRQEQAHLSRRQTEILSLLIKGRSNKEISSSLSITEHAVKYHLKALFNKLNVNDRTNAAIHAVRKGIVHLE
jgi:DNA-binding NarL/FixJ family response regulator